MVCMILCCQGHKFDHIGLQVAGSVDSKNTTKKNKKKNSEMEVKIDDSPNIETYWFYQTFGFTYDTRPRDDWLCFEPKDNCQITMLLDISNKSEEEIVELCQKKLTKSGSKYLPKGYVRSGETSNELFKKRKLEPEPEDSTSSKTKKRKLNSAPSSPKKVASAH